ncbi:MAG: SPOR domain-containing protein [Candidatus Omnitrophica bacterium]|nr:SPOR domain-containing protein [Candidatus Omnitrophota bacterium]
MDKKSNPQLDLFTQSRISPDGDLHDSPARISAIRRYEKLLLLSISFIVAIIISFSLGVEKGKRVTVLKSQVGFNAALTQKAASPAERVLPAKGAAVSNVPQKEVPVSFAIGKTETAAASPVQIQKPVPVPENKSGAFTIQVASFRTKAHAQKEVQALKQTGQPVYLTAKGKYTVLCIGNFSDKEAAKSLLPELKKSYQDCFIRRL